MGQAFFQHLDAKVNVVFHGFVTLSAMLRRHFFSRHDHKKSETGMFWIFGNFFIRMQIPKETLFTLLCMNLLDTFFKLLALVHILEVAIFWRGPCMQYEKVNFKDFI